MMSAVHERAGATTLIGQVRDARTSEASAALLAADSLRRLRDERLYDALDAKSVPDLLGLRLPGLDRVSADILLSLAESFVGQDLSALAPLGLSKLAVIAGAPASDRAGLVHDARFLPLADLRWRLRDAASAREANALRDGSELAASTRGKRFKAPDGWEERRTESERKLAAEMALGELDRAWEESGAHAFEAARGLARLRDEHGWEALGDASLAGMAEEELGMSRDELERALALVDHLSLLPLEDRRRLGIRALRELALVEPAERRSRLLIEAQAQNLSGDRLIARARSERLNPGLETSAEPGTSPVEPLDDPGRLDPFDILFLDDEPTGGPRFEGVTPELLAEQLLRRASRQGERVLDLTAGLGTFGRVGTRLGRAVTSVDRLDPPLADGISIGDARNVSPEGAPFACVIFDPPTPGELRYSERYTGGALAGDLSLLDPEAFSRSCIEVFRHIRKNLLAPDGRLVVLGHPSRAFGRYFDWPARLGIMAERNGFVLVDAITAVVGPDTRRTRLARYGFRARQENRTIPTTLSALILVPDRGEGRR